MYDKAAIDIPPGWVLCDGGNGTPDLRNLFICGTPDGIDPAIGNQDATHSHTFDDGTHRHEITGGDDIEGGDDWAAYTENETVSGTTDLSSSIPPYYTLIFMMKV